MNKTMTINDGGNLGITVEVKDSGPAGPAGSPPEHELSADGAKIRFENPDGSWGSYIELVRVKDLDYNSLRNKPIIGGLELEGVISLKDIGADTIKNEDIKKLI